MSEQFLEIENVTIKYQTSQRPLTAVSDASLTVDEGDYYGIVGESGCGKSTLSKSIIGALDKNGTIDSGEIRYKGRDLHEMSEQELNEKIRWKEISWIPQGSMNSLDPLQRVSEQAITIGRAHTDYSKDEILERFSEMFNVVGIPENRINDYPHQFSGGMQQRAIIALSLFLDPSLLIADEPTTALDVIMQDQILKYIDEIKHDLNTSMIMITHDISVVFETCDKLAVMHSGQIAESGPITEIYKDPRHPYSILLQGAFPDHRYPDRNLAVIEGYPTENYGEVSYCTFADRCPWAIDECTTASPELEPVSTKENGHRAACIRKEEVHKKIDGDDVSYADQSGNVQEVKDE